MIDLGKCADALVQVNALLLTFDLPTREWLLKQFNSGSTRTPGGSNTGSKVVHAPVQTRFIEPVQVGSESVHAPVQIGSESVQNRFIEPVQRGGGGGDCLTAFSEFWKCYPKHQGKKEALRKYLQILPNQELQERILRAVHTQMQWDEWTRDSGRFIPLPKTWLNQQRWEDEPTVEPAGSNALAPRTRTNVAAARAFVGRVKA